MVLPPISRSVAAAAPRAVAGPAIPDRKFLFPLSAARRGTYPLPSSSSGPATSPSPTRETNWSLGNGRPMEHHPAPSRRQYTSLRIIDNAAICAHERHDAVVPGMESSGLRPFYCDP